MAERPPADGPAGQLQAFVNTGNLYAGTEDLKQPDDARRWLADRGLLAPRAHVDEDSHRQVLAFREALRSLMRANNGAPLEPEAAERLNAIGAAASLQPRLDANGHPTLEAADDGVAGALGRLLAMTFSTMLDGTFRRLKACRSPDCQWIFYDRSPNASGAWCERSSATCGSRHKMREYRRRTKQSRADGHRAPDT